ncbi:hypothetical protein G647_01149 [Cladophialophora carrionii CBS 160.54]|uniref:Uncharacterized protein n=1 Tax=Cladophialophora carrionii CBS 160.54 TaxID=1279043 RepID=V9DQV9_9EURO|nr:uncharacterized protein G647_01149 [Cladophialophora carrionii CBS 160.54]ETI28698.1 hypothetical protein G647_01149 [Cladophialophora carrionii CBS 160.54]
MAYISYARALSETMVFLPSPDQGIIETISLREGRLDFEQRRLERLPAAAAGALLFAFCEEFVAPGGMSPENFRHVCGILQQLLRSSGEKGAFARDRLPLGIQGVKELDWTKQNDQFRPIREEHRGKGKEPERENQSHTWTGPTGDKYTFHGCFDEDLVIVDESLKEAGLLKFVCHTFDVPGSSQVRWSWQVFAKLNHPEFAAFCPGQTETEFQAYGTLILASLKFFSECRCSHEQLCRLGEELMLRQEIKRGEFLALTTVASESAAVAVAESSHRGDEKKLPVGRDSDSSADPDSQKQKENTHSRSSSQTSSSSALDAMDATPIGEVLVHNQESKKAKKPKKKKKKPKKQANTQSPTPSERSDPPPAEPEALQLFDDKAKSIAPNLPINPSTPDMATSAQHQTQANGGVPTSVDQNANQLAGSIAKMRLPPRPTIPLPPKPPPSAVAPSGLYDGSWYSQNKDLRENEDRTAFSNVPNKSTVQPTSFTGPPMPTPPTTHQQAQDKKSSTGVAASTPEKLSKKEAADTNKKTDIVQVSEPGVNKGASGREIHVPSSASSQGQVVPRSSNDVLSVESATGDVRVKQAPRDQGPIQRTEKAQGKVSGEDRKVEGSTKKESVTNPHRRNLVQCATSNPAPPLPEFKFDSFHPLLKCPKPDCRAMTSCWDRNVVICPACGTGSFTRYCKKQHLYEDIQRHWVLECRQNKITGPIDQDTIRPYQIPKRAYIMGQMPNLVERHRQAVYRAMDAADYFIFADLDEIDPSIAEPTPAQWNAVRGTGKLAVQVKLELTESLGCESRLFTYHIQRILAVGRPAALDSCHRALSMIRNALVRSGNWTEEVLTYLCMQLPGEWGGYRVPDSYWNVAEVNALWNIHRTLPA